MGSRSVEITSNDDRATVDVDATNEALTVMDEIHKNIHRGVMFSIGHSAESVADDGVLELLIQVGANKAAHMRFTGSAGGDHEVELFEGTTFSAAGTSLTPMNRNRLSSNTAEATVTHTPTLTGDGTQLVSGIMPGGSDSSGGRNTPGSTTTGFSEWILQLSTVYLARIKNLAGTAQPLSMQIDFYEP